MSGYVKSFKVKEGDNKLMSFCIDDKKLLEKYRLNHGWSVSGQLRNLNWCTLNCKREQLAFFVYMNLTTFPNVLDDTFY